MRKTIRGGNHDFSTARGSPGCAQVQKSVLLGLFAELAPSAGLDPVPGGARRTRSGKAEGSQVKGAVSAWQLPRSLCASARYSGAERR
jgi:hypothetical protein